MGEELGEQAKTLATETYPLLRDAMKMDPTLSSVRRSAERARDLALNIPSKAGLGAESGSGREAKKPPTTKPCKVRERQELQRSPQTAGRPARGRTRRLNGPASRHDSAEHDPQTSRFRENREALDSPLGSPRPTPEIGHLHQSTEHPLAHSARVCCTPSKERFASVPVASPGA